jgi:hypothetical protein
MACSKYTLTNTGSTIVNFSYRRCDDSLWDYQVELLTNQTKNIWVIDGTYTVAPAFKSGISLIDEGPFPPMFATNTPTPSNSPTPSPTVTPTETPTNTPTNTETPTNTPTPTQTLTPTTNRNLIIVNNSTTNQVISVTDDSGSWILTDQVGSFSVLPGQTLYANHGTTSTNPRVNVSWATSADIRVFTNGVQTSNPSYGGSGGTVAVPINFASQSTPVDSADTIYILVTN